LCEGCARSRGIAADKEGLRLSLNDLIAGVEVEGASSPSSRACPVCGMELTELKRRGKLGCPSCADAFRDEIVHFLGPRRILSTSERWYPEGDTAAARQPDDPGFLFDPAFVIRDDSPESDVVLWTSARVCRNVEGAVFPESLRAHASSPIPHEVFAGIAGWRITAMAEMGACARRSIAERGLVPRGYAALSDAVLAVSDSKAAYALLGDEDHLRIHTLRPGLDISGALDTALETSAHIGRSVNFAFRPGIGWICTRLADCGRGFSLSVFVHLPALSAVGLLDRLLKTLMAEGAAIRGLYSSTEGSAGSVYEIGVDGFLPVEDIPLFLGSAVRNVVAAERRARVQLAERHRAALADSEGRAFGLLRYCLLLGADEAASSISSLRLASLRGALRAASPARLGALLLSLGPGSLALAAGMNTLPRTEEQDALRARIVKTVLKEAEYRVEEDS
jgi:protein arginine kinase